MGLLPPPTYRELSLEPGFNSPEPPYMGLKLGYRPMLVSSVSPLMYISSQDKWNNI